MNKPKAVYDRLIAEMPGGAERAVLRALSFHVGLPAAIRKADLLETCAKTGTRFSDERQLRLTIVKLRKSGVPICASSGDSGYFLASSLDEYREFRAREYVKKIADMRETVEAMDVQAKAMFAAEYAAYQRDKAEAAGQPALI